TLVSFVPFVAIRRRYGQLNPSQSLRADEPCRSAPPAPPAPPPLLALTANNPAPTTSAANPPSSCSRVAPAPSPSDVVSATMGTKEPSGATKAGGGIVCANAGERSRSVAALTPA